MLHMIADALRDAWQSFIEGIVTFLPRVFAMLSIVLVGWLLAWLFGYLTRRVLGWLRFNALVDRAGGGESMRRAGLPPADRVAGSIVYWIMLVGFLFSGVQGLGLSGMETVASDFMHFVPKLAVAIVILVAGFGIATFAWRATLLAAVNASIQWARALSEVVRFLILSLAVAMALEQVAVAHSVVLTAFAITFGAIMLGVAIAIGIGGSGVVRRALEQKLEERRKPEPDSESHL